MDQIPNNLYIPKMAATQVVIKLPDNVDKSKITTIKGSGMGSYVPVFIPDEKKK